MKKTLSIAQNLVLRLFRSGAGWGLMLLTSAVAVMMFWLARSDGNLVSELQIRIRYSLFFSTGLLNLALMYLACISLRKDIDNRNFHTISAAPVHRGQIWLGKYLGLLFTGISSFVMASLMIGICCGIYIKYWGKDSEREKLKNKFYRAYYVCEPQLSSLDSKVEAKFKKMQIAGMLPANKPYGEIKRDLYTELRRQEQMLPPEASKQWTFEWTPGQGGNSKFLILKTKFYAEKKHNKIAGEWILDAPESSTQWSTEFSGYPYNFIELKIPMEQVPRSRILRLTFKGKGTPYLIFPRKNGVALLYDNGSIFYNYALMLLMISLHLAVLTALALTLASLFSYSVAVFATLVIYVVGISSGFFVNVLRDLRFEGDEPLTVLAVWAIKLGMWLTQGINIPPVVEMFSDGICLPMLSMAGSWGIGFAIYLTVIIGLGIYMLTKKEIDRILQV
jgi:hypothetical protein